ncbi:MAG: hypothetical protein K0R99_1701 [Microbacterium sp.]|uniref:DUF1028 domain-containing protein n=1 Tax=Microbacterium sp. TaxID=51671 RepID=UPI002613489D|nr:DUF1028 domain-containing protein [Microbacterium sp.]MDF2560255.1 hypothetical protein [Microbacterium sp.]
MTYTVLARNPSARLIGAATASRSLAVGNAVISVDPAAGAVASQAWTNRALRGQMLAAIANGSSAADAVAAVAEWDDAPELRQVAALGWSGAPAARSGSSISAWAGDEVLRDAVVAGNLLTGRVVLDAMSHVLADPLEQEDTAAFTRRLLASLTSGEAAGGDARGRQSAAVVVATRQDIVVDLRVDDHPDPLAELSRLLSLAS